MRGGAGAVLSARAGCRGVTAAPTGRRRVTIARKGVRFSRPLSGAGGSSAGAALVDALRGLRLAVVQSLVSITGLK